MQNKQNIINLIPQIPKVELHLHLDGAVPPDLLFNFVKRKEPLFTRQKFDEMRNRIKSSDFNEFIKFWVWKNSFIKSREDFRDVAYYVLKSLREQNVRYAEIFYSPADYKRYGISLETITEGILEGRELAFQEFGIECQFILDLVRDYGQDNAMEYLKKAKNYLGRGVIGIGLGGSEHAFPAKDFVKAFREAEAMGFRRVAHAGELDGAQSVRDAVELLGAERIGYGTRSYEDLNLVEMLKEKQIPLEVCMVSNVAQGVCKSPEKHPINDYFNRGLLITINSDDPLMFDSNLNDEYRILVEKLDFTMSDLKTLSLNGVKASFLSDEMKKDMLREFSDILMKLSKNDEIG